jgi:acyl-CoA reductase-like NAD-dependent aldehyde dehydrogenase
VSKLRATSARKPGVDLGPVISKHTQECICSLVESGATDGDRLVLDGQGIKVSWIFFVNV